MSLPGLEEFFLWHGDLIRQPRVVLPFHSRIMAAIEDWTQGRLPDGKRNLAICMPPRHGKTLIAREEMECARDAVEIWRGQGKAQLLRQMMDAIRKQGNL